MIGKKDATNKDFYFTILELIKKGNNPSKIVKELNISKQKLNYYLRRLKDEGLIKKIGYGTWEVKEVKISPTNTLKRRSKNIRGHAFIWKVKLPLEIKDWISILEKKKIKYVLVTKNKIPRIFIKNRKIWLGKNSLTIYESKSFYGKNAIISRKYATISLLEVLEALKRKVGVRLTINNRYCYKPCREHYGLFRNDLAIQCNRNNEKIYISDELDGEWLWVDFSLSVGELETGGKGITQDRAGLNLGVQNWYNDHKKHKFQVTPTLLLESLNDLAKIQKIELENKKEYSRDLVQHKNSIMKMGYSTEANTKSIELLADIMMELKKEVKKLGK